MAMAADSAWVQTLPAIGKTDERVPVPGRTARAVRVDRCMKIQRQPPESVLQIEVGKHFAAYVYISKNKIEVDAGVRGRALP
jgi:hypothetical protein